MLGSKSNQSEPRGALVARLLRLAWPIAVSMLSYSLMTAVDTLFVGRSGAAAIAAVGLGGMVSFTLLTFGMGLLRGGKVLSAYSFGAGNHSKTEELAKTNVALAAVLSVLTLAVTILVAPLLRKAFSDAHAGQLVVSYVQIRAVSIPFFLISCAVREICQGVGDSQRPMRAAVIANVVNIPLNALLVIGLGLGVVGSAVANVLAQVVELVCLYRSRPSWFRGMPVEVAKIREIVRLGWPLGLEMFLDVSSFSTLAIIIAKFGAVELAAHQIAIQIAHLTILPILAVAEAASVLAGHACGSGRTGDVRLIARVSVAVGLSVAASTALALVSIPGTLAGAFTSDVGVRPLAEVLIRMVSGFQLGFVLYAVGRGVLRGLGDLRFTSFVTVGVAWLCTPTLGLILGQVFGFGVVGGWCGLSLEITVASSLYIWRLEHGSWKKAAGKIQQLYAGYEDEAIANAVTTLHSASVEES